MEQQGKGTETTNAVPEQNMFESSYCYSHQEESAAAKATAVCGKWQAADFLVALSQANPPDLDKMHMELKAVRQDHGYRISAVKSCDHNVIV